MSVKTPLALALIPFLVTPVLADQPHLKWINDWKDVQLYLKPKFNGIRSWDQEFGIQATIAKYGNWTESLNFSYDPSYPIRLDQKPRLSLGEQTTYFFTKLPSKLGVYTKFKPSPFPYTWKQESGFTGRLYTSRSLIVSANAAYMFTYPFRSSAKPQFLFLVNFQFPLH
jgi:hypothetical protein